MRGHVVDMAVGIVIGAAFGTIVKSFVADVLMPPIGLFINTIISFVIVAFAVFMVIKSMNSTKKPEAPADPTTKDCPACCSSIEIKATRCPNCTTEIAAA